MSTRALAGALAMLACESASPARARADDRVLYGVASYTPAQLVALDPSDGSTRSTLVITRPPPRARGGEAAGAAARGDETTYEAANGIASHPETGALYVLLREAPQSPSTDLATVDPATGAASPIAALPDRFAALAFACDGRLFGLTGDGGLSPQTLYEIDPTTGATTLVVSFGASGPEQNGEALAFRRDDGLLYRLSGQTGLPPVLVAVDLEGPTTSSVDVTGNVFNTAMGLVYDEQAGQFLVADFDLRFGTLTAEGVGSFTSTVANYYRGFTFPGWEACGGIFRDGFEAGPPAAWSGASP